MVYAWLAENAHEYGFILRYPQGKEELPGISYEPWHYRYVGIEAAREIYDRGGCLVEYVQVARFPGGSNPPMSKTALPFSTCKKRVRYLGTEPFLYISRFRAGADYAWPSCFAISSAKFSCFFSRPSPFSKRK